MPSKKGIHIAQVAAGAPHPSSDQLGLSEEELADGYTYEDEELDAETMALMSPSEINAFFKQRGQRTWQQQTRRNGQRPGGPPRRPQLALTNGGNRTVAHTPGPSTFKPRCYNCGKEGHRSDACREPKRELKDRPCIRCGSTSLKIARRRRQPERSTSLSPASQR